jgi:hypothetical protein
MAADIDTGRRCPMCVWCSTERPLHCEFLLEAVRGRAMPVWLAPAWYARVREPIADPAQADRCAAFVRRGSGRGLG